MGKGEIVGYIFNDEAQALLAELIRMRSYLGLGEFFCEEDTQKYDELNTRLNRLMGRHENIKERF